MTLWGLPWLKMLKGPVRATMTCGPLKVPNQGSESEEHSCSTYSSSVSGGGRSSWSSSCGTSSWMRHMSSEVVATAVCWQIPRPVEWCCLFLPRNLIGLTQRRFAYHDTCMAKVCKSTMVTCCCKTSNIVQVCTSLQQTLQTPSKLIFCRSLTKKKMRSRIFKFSVVWSTCTYLVGRSFWRSASDPKVKCMNKGHLY